MSTDFINHAVDSLTATPLVTPADQNEHSSREGGRSGFRELLTDSLDETRTDRDPPQARPETERAAKSEVPLDPPVQKPAADSKPAPKSSVETDDLENEALPEAQPQEGAPPAEFVTALAAANPANDVPPPVLLTVDNTQPLLDLDGVEIETPVATSVTVESSPPGGLVAALNVGESITTVDTVIDQTGQVTTNAVSPTEPTIDNLTNAPEVSIPLNDGIENVGSTVSPTENAASNLETEKPIALQSPVPATTDASTESEVVTLPFPTADSEVTPPVVEEDPASSSQRSSTADKSAPTTPVAADSALVDATSQDVDIDLEPSTSIPEQAQRTDSNSGAELAAPVAVKRQTANSAEPIVESESVDAPVHKPLDSVTAKVSLESTPLQNSDRAELPGGRDNLVETESAVVSQSSESTTEDDSGIGRHGPVLSGEIVVDDTPAPLGDGTRTGETSPAGDGSEAQETSGSAAAQPSVEPRLTPFSTTVTVPETTVLDAQQPEFLHHLSQVITHAADNRQQVMLRLTPPELGTLQIEVVVENGAVSARIDAQTAGARNLLLENISQLREALSQNGSSVERVEVFLADNSSEGRGEQLGQSFTQEQDRRDTASSETPGHDQESESGDAAEQVEQAESQTNSKIGTGQLDITI